MSVSTDPTVTHREDLPWPDEPPDTNPEPVPSTPVAVEASSGNVATPIDTEMLPARWAASEKS